jgi:hypothetical protein
MNFNRDVLRRRRDQMNEMGVKIQWIGRPKRLWSSVIKELEEAQDLTKKNKVLTLNMCVNYGGRSEIVDAATELARDVKRGKVKADSITEKTLASYLYDPKMSDVDLFLRSSGEQRTSNFLPWQSVYAEFVFMDVLWPDVTRKTLWKAIEEYSDRDRRFGKLKNLTFTTESKDLCSMSNIAESMFFSHNFGPFFNCSALNFNGVSTTFTDEVMMVGISTEAVDSFTIITSQYIDDLVTH